MRNKLFITIFMGVVTLALAILCIAPGLTDKSSKPTIMISDVELNYAEGDDTRALLQGISAYDKEDGDLSDSVRVYDITALVDGEHAAITYAVYDSDNNLARATRTIPWKITEATPADATPEDAENTEDDETSTEDESTLTGEGYDDLPLESDGSPVIRLLTHEITMEVGDEFYSMDYVDTAVDDKDSLSELYRRIYLEGDELDTSVAGDYELEYYCVDADENRSNVAKLMVHVISNDTEASTEEE